MTRPARGSGLGDEPHAPLAQADQVGQRAVALGERVAAERRALAAAELVVAHRRALAGSRSSSSFATAAIQRAAVERGAYSKMVFARLCASSISTE